MFFRRSTVLKGLCDYTVLTQHTGRASSSLTRLQVQRTPDFFLRESCFFTSRPSSKKIFGQEAFKRVDIAVRCTVFVPPLVELVSSLGQFSRYGYEINDSNGLLCRLGTYGSAKDWFKYRAYAKLSKYTAENGEVYALSGSLCEVLQACVFPILFLPASALHNTPSQHQQITRPPATFNYAHEQGRRSRQPAADCSMLCHHTSATREQ